MALSTQSIPALHGGVSQQAAVTRSPTQCTEAVNCDFSIARGVSKRAPLEALNMLASADLSKAFYTWTRIPSGRWFLVVVPGDGTYSVFDAETGSLINGTNDTGQAYLTTSGNASEDFYAVSLEEKLYIVNRTVVTALDAGETAGTIAGTFQYLQDPDFTPVAGSIYEILGDENNIKDSFYVKGDGSPVKLFEWVKPGIQHIIVPSTMPHVLTITPSEVNPFGATADFVPEVWDRRTVGDVDSNKAPSFLGHTIDSLFFKSDRLGIISGQSFTASRVGEYVDFWRSTVTDVLDDDRIDHTVNAFEMSNIRYAETVGKSLVMFGDERQFTVDGAPIFSPNSLAVNPSTAYPVSRNARPVSTGATVYFASDAGDFTHLREMFIQDDTFTMEAADVTGHAARYVPANVRVMEVHGNLDQILLASPDEPGNLYSYQYMWQGNDKALSAWGKWQIAAGCQVLSLRAIGPHMYCVYYHAATGGTYLGRFNLKFGDSHEGFDHLLHLDHLQKVTATFNAVENRTYFTSIFPIMAAGQGYTPYLVRGAGWSNLGSYERPGAPWTFNRMTDHQFYVDGDWSGTGTEEWWVGLPYEFKYTFSEQFFNENNLAQLHARVQIRTFTVHFEDTGFFQVDVKVRGHAVVEAEVVPELATSYTARTVGDEYFQLNKPQLVTGTYQFPVLSRASDLVLSLTNDSPLPCSFQSAEWKGLVSRRTAR